jgi:hypothetical protein
MPFADRAPLNNHQGRAEQGVDERQTGLIEHEGLPAVDNSVLGISVLGDPENAPQAPHLEAGAVVDWEYFARLEIDRGVERTSHGYLHLHDADACFLMPKAACITISNLKYDGLWVGLKRSFFRPWMNLRNA